MRTHTGCCYGPDALLPKCIKERTPLTGVTTAAAATEAESSGLFALRSLNKRSHVSDNTLRSTRTFIHLLGIRVPFLSHAGTHRTALVTSTRQCLRTALSIDRALRVSVLLLAVGVTTLGVFNYHPPHAADWLTVGCKNIEPGAQLSLAAPGMKTIIGDQ
ncbi:hypothetical protein V5799_005073 [Amblyomma americanum]|uniref:Uncharacterized protein n=1 Tax=Amblyomma americanum TaxID=6943 RepID=A0AAQ4E0A6_AMBAM